MSIDGQPTVLLGVGTVLAATILLAGTWDSSRRLWRILAFILISMAVVVTSALQLNRMTGTYPSWSDLAGIDAVRATPGNPAETAASSPGRNGGIVLSVTVTGHASGLTLPMLVYLPAAYRTAASRHIRFPVIEALHGYPGSPQGWIRRLDVVSHLDREIAQGRMAPTVVLLPYQTPRRTLDTECTNMTRGPQIETFLTVDVPAYARENLRIRTDRSGWGLIGYSAGGFCAMNLALRHPDRYAAAASLSGYAEPGIAIGDGSEHTTNNVTWRLSHLPHPPTSLFIAWANDDVESRRASLRIAQLAHAPLTVTTAVLPHGGHSNSAWTQLQTPAFDWLSARLARPTLS